MRKFLKPLSFLPAILLMYMIFSFSSQTGDVSSQLSFKVSRKIIQTADYVFEAGLDDAQVDRYASRIEFITRKLAHMTEYFLLAIAVSFPLYVYGMHGFLLTLVAGFICVAFACSDEFHQTMVAGRSPSARDVLIDSSGVLVGIILVRIVGWAGRHTLFRPKPKRKKAEGFFSGFGEENDSYEEPYDFRQEQEYYYKKKAPKGNGYERRETPYRQEAPYRQDAPFRQNVPYGQDFPYGQRVPHVQDAPYSSYDQNPPQEQGASYEPSPPYRQDAPYGQTSPYGQNSSCGQDYSGNVPYGPPHFGEQPGSDAWYADHHGGQPGESHPKKKKREKDWFFDL